MLYISYKLKNTRICSIVNLSSTSQLSDVSPKPINYLTPCMSSNSLLCMSIPSRGRGKWATAWWWQVVVLTVRNFRQSRHTILSKTNIFLTVALCIISSLVWFQVSRSLSHIVLQPNPELAKPSTHKPKFNALIYICYTLANGCFVVHKG